MVNEYNLGANVHFLGECNHVPALLRGGVDVFVSGSREEVFGLVLAEASLASLPVVAPRVGGISSVIEDRVTGLLVEPESSRSIAGAVLRLLNQPGLRRQYGEAGRNKVLRNFNMENYVGRFQSTYLDLIQNQHRQLHFFERFHLRLMINLFLRCLQIYLRKWSAIVGNNRIIIDPIIQRKL